MKIRTDFVTNLISSSFMVNLTMEFQNGESITFDKLIIRKSQQK